MAPVPVTENYYEVLEVDRTATSELITKSYRRLALKLHPDRKGGSKEGFQLLVRAYETLTSTETRRAYDLDHSYRSSYQGTPKPDPPPTSNPQSDTVREAAQIAKIRKAQEERAAQWRVTKTLCESSIFELQRKKRQLEQEINNLKSIAAAEAAIEAQKNSFSAWLMSPFYKKIEESEEDKARKDREKQERKIEKDLKERRYASQAERLREEEGVLERARLSFETADQRSEREVHVIRAAAQARETREQQERQRAEQARQRAEQERLAKIWRQQQEQREKEAQAAREALKKQQEQARAEENIRRIDEALRQAELRRRQAEEIHNRYGFGATAQSNTSDCSHGGWWEKVQGRRPCPECSQVWTYLLECPHCPQQACPKCQRRLRPSYRGNSARTRQARQPRPRSPTFDWSDYDL